MNNAILEARGLTKAYKNGPWALQGVDLALPKGRIVGMLGPNGSGKTTLIKLAAGLLTPTGGEILIHGEAPGVSTKARVAYLPEQDFLPRWMKAEDTVAYYADFFPDFDRAKAQEMLTRLGISAEMRVQTMSKGTKEKLQLALVMSRAADLYLLDEPIGGVDPAARDLILDTIISNYREEATVVLSTHLIADIERVLDEVVFINMGKIGMVATVDDIRENQGKSVDALFREVYKC